MNIVRRQVGSIDVLDLSGRLTAASGKEFIETVRRLSNAGNLQIVVNLEAIEFIDSTGLGYLVTSARQLATRGGRLFILNPAGAVRRLFQITKLDSICFHDEQALLAALAA